MDVLTYINKDNWPSDIEGAREFAREALECFKYRDEVPKLLKAVEQATCVARVQYIIVNAILSGEGNKVIKR